MQIDFEFIREQLERRKRERQLGAVAKGADVSKRTLTYIIGGRASHFETAEKLQVYLKNNVRKKKLGEADSESPDTESQQHQTTEGQ